MNDHHELRFLQRNSNNGTDNTQNNIIQYIFYYTDRTLSNVNLTTKLYNILLEILIFTVFPFIINIFIINVIILINIDAIIKIYVVNNIIICSVYHIIVFTYSFAGRFNSYETNYILNVLILYSVIIVIIYISLIRVDIKLNMVLVVITYITNYILIYFEHVGKDGRLFLIIHTIYFIGTILLIIYIIIIHTILRLIDHNL